MTETLAFRLTMSYPHYRKILISDEAVERLLNYMFQVATPFDVYH